MKTWRNASLAFMFLLLLFVLIRIFPVLVRIGQLMLSGIHSFWWAVLPLLIVGTSIWIFKKRRIALKNSKNLSNRPELRDVTNSIQE